MVIAALVFNTLSCGRKEGPREDYQDEIDYSEEPVTITYVTIGDKPSNGMTERIVEELNKILVKKVNAKLDVYYVAWDDYLNNYNATLENAEVDIDLVGTSVDWLDAWPNAIQGHFYPLSKEMLQQYCPNTYSSVSSSEWEKCSYDGTIYFIPENEYTQWTNHGFIYRKDLAMEAGLSSGVNSWEDLDKYFRYIKKAYPKMIPWDTDGTSLVATLGYLCSAGSYCPIYELSTYGLWGAYDDDRHTIVSPYYEGDDFVEYAKLMKKWNDMGVWRADFSMAGDNEEEFYNGETAVIQHHTQYYYTLYKPNAEVMLPEADVSFFWFGKESGNLSKTSILHGAMAVYSGSKNPERALMVYDLLRNDKRCYDLVRYGIEGIQYEKDREGMIERPSGYNSSRDDFVLNYWWGRRDKLELQDSSYAWDDYYDLTNEYSRFAYDYPWDSVPFSTRETNEVIESVVRVCDRYLPEIASGKYDQPAEDEVAEFRKALKDAGMEKATRHLQAILDSD